MKKSLKILILLFGLLIAAITYVYFSENEKLPDGKKGQEAEELAAKMFAALNGEAFYNTEIITWSFRNVHHYKWYKSENKVSVSWDENNVILDTKNYGNSEVFINHKKVENEDVLQTAIKYFNNDSFWLIAPYKIFDQGTERRLVKHNNKDALLITYTSGGTTPGDSYLWILDENYLPTSFKMWTSLIPIGGISATWSNLKTTSAGLKLPTAHKLSLFGMEITLENVQAYNKKADELAHKILKAIKHKNYKNTRYLEWSFAGKRHFKWDKKLHIVQVSWDSIRVELHPNNIENSLVYVNEKIQEKTDTTLVKKANNIFNNDSFWLVAPHKLFDKGTYRNIIKENNKEALYIKYTSGGTTPGDSYSWFLDENNVPNSYKMTVPSMKMSNVPATWQDWIVTESGTLLPTNHIFSSGNKLSLGTVKGYN